MLDSALAGIAELARLQVEVLAAPHPKIAAQAAADAPDTAGEGDA
jgi:ribonuclease PH